MVSLRRHLLSVLCFCRTGNVPRKTGERNRGHTGYQSAEPRTSFVATVKQAAGFKFVGTLKVKIFQFLQSSRLKISVAFQQFQEFEVTWA
jgi:hypothetical protein